METLTQMKCIACRKDEPTVTDAETADFQPQVSAWDIVELDGIKRLRRVFSLDDFAQALAFTNKVGELAEEEGHHPALLTEWGRTTVTWWTHKIRGLHRNDFVMAVSAITDPRAGGGNDEGSGCGPRGSLGSRRSTRTGARTSCRLSSSTICQRSAVDAKPKRSRTFAASRTPASGLVAGEL
jgi:4a-hydroxytetrahydrobiopterin dehydratase